MAFKNGKYSDKKKTHIDQFGAGIKDKIAEEQIIMGSNESKKTIKFSSWSQNDTEVTIMLFAGRKLSDKDVSVEFTDTGVKVGLTDGRKWSCTFNQPVDRTSCRVQLKKMKLVLIVKKKTTKVQWPSYEAAATTILPSEPGSILKSDPMEETIDSSVQKLPPLEIETRRESPSFSSRDVVCAVENVDRKETVAVETNPGAAGDRLARGATDVGDAAKEEGRGSGGNESEAFDLPAETESTSCCGEDEIITTSTCKSLEVGTVSDGTNSTTFVPVNPSPSYVPVNPTHPRVPVVPFDLNVPTNPSVPRDPTNPSDANYASRKSDGFLTKEDFFANETLTATTKTSDVMNDSGVFSYPSSVSVSCDAIDGKTTAMKEGGECEEEEVGPGLGPGAGPGARGGGAGEPETASPSRSYETEIRNSVRNARLLVQRAPPSLSPPPEQDSAENDQRTQAFTSTMSEEVQDEIVDLVLVKQDMYEMSTDQLVLCIYVKNIIAETLKVVFEELELQIFFQTTDEKFLQLYEGSTNKTTFRWSVHLVAAIVPEKCTYIRSLSKIQINLVKQVHRKWGTLTAMPSMAKTGSASSPQTVKNTWISTSQSQSADGNDSSASRLMNNGSQREQPVKVIFDELSDPTPNASVGGNRTSRDQIFNTDNTRRETPNKPTCMVSPLTNWYGDSTVSSSSSPSSSSSAAPLLVPTSNVAVSRPGMMGLDNLGNTCFMNSVLQVLANTVELKDYFLDGIYQKELNYDNPLGMGGKLAVAFGHLLKVLWTTNQRSFEPSKLKSLVAMKQTRFVGYSQHDAEEFMEFLLDGLHEDLNRIQVKPYFQEKDVSEESDKVAADEAWKRHKLRNDSRIIDTFQGQYRSRVVCPACETVSITFDPFSIIQVPIPKKKKLINVIFMSQVTSNKPVEYQIQIGVDGTVEHLKEALNKKTKVPLSNLRILEVSESKIVNYFTKGSSLSKVTSSDLIIACEVVTEAAVGEPVYELVIAQRTILPRTIPRCCAYCHRESVENRQLKRCTRCYKISYCDQECQKKDWSRHKLLCVLEGEPIGCPFIVSIPASKLTFSHLCSTVEAYARYSVNAFQPPPLSRRTIGSRNGSPVSSLLSSSSSSVYSSSSSLERSDDAERVNVADPVSIATSLAREAAGGRKVTVEVDSPDLGGDGVKDAGVGVESEEGDAIGKDKNMEESSERGADEDGVKVVETASEAGDSTQSARIRKVFGIPQNAPPLPPPPFYLRPCTLQGTFIVGAHKLQDQASELLDLSSVRCLLVQWKNKEKCDPYVEVKTRSLIEDSEESNVRIDNDSSGNTEIQLSDCLTLFTEPEVLSADQTWYCPKCKAHCQALKEMSLWRMPPTLIVHLKRFSFTSFTSMYWRNKIDDMVEFPIRDLDMTRYYKGHLSPNEPPPIYDLYGVINHQGDLLGGHYTCFARCPRPDDASASQIGWRLFDDSIVKVCSESQIVTRSAYVLFYRRREETGPPMLFDGTKAPPVASSSSMEDLRDVGIRAEETDDMEIDGIVENELNIVEASSASAFIEDTDIDAVD